MSMNYGEIVEYGMLVDQEMVALVIRYLLKNTSMCGNLSQEDTDFLMSDNFSIFDKRIKDIDIDHLSLFCNQYLLDKGLCFEIFSSFDGRAESIAEIDEYYGISEENALFKEFDDDSFLFIPLKKETSLFKVAYDSPSDIVDELKERLSFIDGIDEIDIPSKICVLCGVTYCYNNYKIQKYSLLYVNVRVNIYY